jgi:type I restriction enzyme S subunit
MRHVFPARWKAQKLDKLGFVGRGRSRQRPRNEPSLYGGEYPFFQTGDIKAANLYLSEYSQTYNEKGLAQSKQWEPGTLCITIAANIADTAILGIRGCFPDSVIGFISDPAKADVHFIKYYIDLIKLDMQQVSHGTTQDNLSIDKLLRFDFVVPDVEEQRKIAAILSAYDDLIENNLRRIKILEEMAQNLYREWFVKFRFPGHEQVRFVDSPLGRIPEGWEVVALGELVNTQYGYTESAQEKPIGPKYLRGMDINKTTYIDWDAVPYCPIPDDRFPKYQLAEGDIVIIRMADPGKVGIVEKDVNAVFASYLVRLSRTSNRIGPYYLFHFLIAERYQGYITGASTGTTRKSASAGVLTGIDILIPPESILADFESQVQAFRRLLNNLLERNTTLRRTRDLLLPRLISGEVDVSELDIAVPEEALT